jgi:pSer/pThr/pTyr-binding forkhead associated (FHA) protein
MAATVTLTVRGGPAEESHVFTEPARFLVGRGSDCDVSLPAGSIFQQVSRHHCEFDIDPPHVAVRDLGSRNGTWVNGKLIGRRPADACPEMADPRIYAKYPLADGDEVELGHPLVRVGIAVGRKSRKALPVRVATS